MRLVAPRAQGDALAALWGELGSRARHELRRLAAHLRNAEDERVRADLLDDLDMGRQPVGRELQRLRAQAEDDRRPAVLPRRDMNLGPAERDGAVHAKRDGAQVHRR